MKEYRSLTRSERRASQGASYASRQGGAFEAYKLAPWKLTKTPTRLIYNPTNAPANITEAKAKGTIWAAKRQWETATTKEIFDEVEVSKDRPKDACIISWKPQPFDIAVAQPHSDGKGNITYTEIFLNSNLKWVANATQSKNNAYKDLRTVIMHELGHAIGMADIYNTVYKNDYEQIMNLYYPGPQWYLGNGDKAGVKKIYENQ